MFDTKKKKKTPKHVGESGDVETSVALPSTGDIDIDALLDAGDKATRKKAPVKKVEEEQDRDSGGSIFGRCGC